MEITPELYIEKLHDDVNIPKYHSAYAMAMDIHAYMNVAESDSIDIMPHETKMIGTGLKVQPEAGFCTKVYPRSGLAAKLNINLTNCVGLIDRDYEGELRILLHNNNASDIVTIEHGERIAQLMVERYQQAKIKVVDKLPDIDSERGINGFGSTGGHKSL